MMESFIFIWRRLMHPLKKDRRPSIAWKRPWNALKKKIIATISLRKAGSYLAKLGFELEDYDRSRGCLARVRALSSGIAQHSFNMGIIYQKMGRHREAIEMFRQVSGKKSYSPAFSPRVLCPIPSSCSFIRLIASIA